MGLRVPALSVTCGTKSFIESVICRLKLVCVSSGLESMTATAAAEATAAAVTATAAAATATAATRKKRDHNLEETGKRTLRLGGQVQTKILIKARREEHMGLAHGPRLSLLEFYKSQVSKPQNLSKLVESIAKTTTPAFEDRLRFV